MISRDEIQEKVDIIREKIEKNKTVPYYFLASIFVIGTLFFLSSNLLFSFVHYMYASAGVQLGDRASVVTFSLVNMGEKINPSEMKRGDIIFFDTYTIDGHVGVYLGEGKFIHDGPTNGVEITDMTLPYWQQTFNGKVRRVVK